MPCIVAGSLWDQVDHAQILLVTTNSELNSKYERRYELVMGCGAALEAKVRYPTLPSVLGRLILQRCGSLGTYGVLLSMIAEGRTQIGAFQTKTAYRRPSLIHVIDKAVTDLQLLAWLMPCSRIVLNFPGIGAGGLDPRDVWRVLQRLPDNVFLYVQNEQELLNLQNLLEVDRVKSPNV